MSWIKQNPAFVLVLSMIALLVGVSLAVTISRSPLNEIYIRTIILDYIDKGLLVDDVFPDDIEMPADPNSYFVAEVLEGEATPPSPFPTLSGMKYIRYIASAFVRDTPFEGKLNINSPPEIGHINIYFLREDSESLSNKFENNCTFIGYYRAILCDAHFFESIFQEIDQINEVYDIAFINLDEEGGPPTIERPDMSSDNENTAMIRALMKANILTWVLGHEIGHAILHYELVTGGEKSFHFDLGYDTEEEEADTFVAEQSAVTDERAAELLTFLAEFIHQEFRREFIRKHQDNAESYRDALKEVDFPLKNKIRVAQGRFSVPLLLRALYVVKALLKVAPWHQDVEYYDTIAKNIEIKQSAL